MLDIFISYASEDLNRIKPFAEALQNEGFSVFWDRTIPPGKVWRQFIGDALEDTRCVIVVWTKASIKSSWVQEEADSGLKRGILIPVFFDKVEPPLGFRNFQAADLSNWNPDEPSEKLITFFKDIREALKLISKQPDKGAIQRSGEQEGEYPLTTVMPSHAVLVAARETAKITQEELSYRTGVNVAIIKSLEKGGELCLIDTLKIVTKALHIDYSTAILDIKPGTRTIAEQIDFETYIQEKTKEFVGRNAIFDATEMFVQNNPRGYFLLRGDPGIGKSAIAAQFVKQHVYVHHFNIRAAGICNPEIFLNNLLVQLCARFELDATVFCQRLLKPGGLTELLNAASKKLSDNNKLVIIIDALDEVDRSAHIYGENLLYLPSILPKGVYIVTTLRHEPVPLRIDCEQTEFNIQHDGPDNVGDIRRNLNQSLRKRGIQKYLAAQKISKEKFIDILAKKSEGNFIYLVYVLAEIMQCADESLDLNMLPSGLANYYEDHWRRMRDADEDSWFAYKLPVVVALTVTKAPVSIELLAKFSGIRQRARIVDVLEQWKSFLHVTQEEKGGERIRVYSLYHNSFYDFIKEKDQVKEAGVSLKQFHKNIAHELQDAFKEFIHGK